MCGMFFRVIMDVQILICVSIQIGLLLNATKVGNFGEVKWLLRVGLSVDAKDGVSC